MNQASIQIEVRPLARLFRALGDETRLRIVALLSHGELCVCHIQEALGLSQPNTSRQLGVLRAAGVVDSRREGGWAYYKLAEQSDEECQHHLSALTEAFARKRTLRTEIKRLCQKTGPDACC
ncbi:MAG: metalloregulator ArsR/SmtB family transcription factor [Polyangia bacterium]